MIVLMNNKSITHELISPKQNSESLGVDGAEITVPRK